MSVSSNIAKVESRSKVYFDFAETQAYRGPPVQIYEKPREQKQNLLRENIKRVYKPTKQLKRMRKHVCAKLTAYSAGAGKFSPGIIV